MSKPARTATPEELADENRRSEEARAAIPPASDPTLAAAVKEVRRYDNLSDLLADGRWLPATPAEVAAALQFLAGDINSIWDVECNSDPSLHSLREHVLALESLVVGQDVHSLAALDEDLDGDTPARVAFHRLYQRFQRGEDAGLNQRLSEAEARIARLEARLSTSTDWRPDPADLAQQFLWLRGRCDGGPDIGQRDDDPSPIVGLALADLASHALRPKTWAQLLDCLQMLAQEVQVLISNAERDPDDPYIAPADALPPADEDDKERLAKVLAAAYPVHGA